MTGKPDGLFVAPLIPALAVACLAAFVVVAALVGSRPFWNGDNQTLPEAAYLGDVEAAARLVERGDSLDAPAVVRGDVTKEGDLTLTPLQAAAMTDRSEMAEYLLDKGASVASDPGLKAACIAEAKGAAATLEVLRGAGATPDAVRCPALVAEVSAG